MEQNAVQVVPQLAGLFNVFVGGMLVIGVTFGVGGFIDYITHLGLQQRDNGLEYMKWGIYTLFLLAVILWLSQFIQHNTAFTIAVLGAAIVFGIIWLIASDLLAPKKEESEKKK